MKKAFTMIELIFVIVIIGILAAVAMPKLAANRDDAEASTCIYEIGQFVQELGTTYTKLGNAEYLTTPISDMTNIILVTAASGDNGIVGTVGTTLVPGSVVAYECGGEEIVTFVGENSGAEYNLTVTVTAGITPISQIVAQKVITNILGGNSSKIFGL